MSEEQLKAFLEKVKGDTSLQEKLKAEGADPVAIAKEAGFMISTDDITNTQYELSDEELEGVAGGTRDRQYLIGSDCPDGALTLCLF